MSLTWEYKIVERYQDEGYNHGVSEGDFLKTLGADGWELIEIQTIRYPHLKWRYYFKKANLERSIVFKA